MEMFLRVLEPVRFLHDPARMTPRAEEIPGGRRLVFIDSNRVLDFEAEIVLLGEDGGFAHAAFLPRSARLLRALNAFARKHGASIPARFERRWSGRDDPAVVLTSLKEMIRKTVENMHMVHTAAPVLLPPFPLEYLASEYVPGHVHPPQSVKEFDSGGGGRDVRVAGENPPPAKAVGTSRERWRWRLQTLIPSGTPVLSRDDRTRLLRCLMTDESLLERPGDAAAVMSDVVAALKRMDSPREEWARGDDGEPLKPPSAALVLARLTNIRWMNETAEVSEARRKAGLRSAFGIHVSLLSALPDDHSSEPGETPSFAAASAAAILINWLTPHLNFYPLEGLGHRSDRIDFITTRLLFEEILNPFYSRCVEAGQADLKSLSPPLARRRLLSALRDGFLHESRLPAPSRRGWADRLGALFGRTPPTALPIESVAPLSIFREQTPEILGPLADPESALYEAFQYGLGRSISDGKEYWSATCLRSNLAALRAQCGGSMAIRCEELAERATCVCAEIAGPPPRWEDLSPRDQAYVTPGELAGGGFISLPTNWRKRVRSAVWTQA